MKKPIIVSLMVVIMLMCSLEVNRTYANTLDEDNILFITDKMSFASIGTESNSFIVIDKSLMNEIPKDAMLKVFINKGRIMIRGDISRNEVREYFGLEQKNYIEENIRPNEKPALESNIADVSGFASVGKLIYKDETGINITDIRTEDHENDGELLGTIKYCFMYDYFKLIRSSGPPETISYSYSWSNSDIDTSTYSAERCMINTMIKIDRNDGNPNYSGEYLSHVGYAVDTEMKAAWFLDETDVEVHGRATSLVYAYGPARVNIQKIAGGIDNNNFKAKFNAVTIFGTDAVTGSMLAEADIEAYQPSSGYFFGYGQFHIKTFAYNWHNQITYYNSGWDTASGS